jgi:hypothetical protein
VPDADRSRLRPPADAARDLAGRIAAALALLRESRLAAEVGS